MNGQAYRRDDGTYRTKNEVYLKPGEVWIDDQPTMVTTVLGSCVSATFFHPASRLSAICHVLQPRCRYPYKCGPECEEIFRYATCAIEAITERFSAKGARSTDIEVKLFGGASLIGNNKPDQMAKSVGRQNVEAAMETIQKIGLHLRVINVGGKVGRKIKFNSVDGIVLMKRLKGALFSDFRQ